MNGASASGGPANGGPELDAAARVTAAEQVTGASATGGLANGASVPVADGAAGLELDAAARMMAAEQVNGASANVVTANGASAPAVDGAARPPVAASGCAVMTDDACVRDSIDGDVSEPDSAPPVALPPELDPLAPAGPSLRERVAQLGFLFLTLAARISPVAHQWARVRAGFAELGPLPLVAALVPALGSVAAMMLAWRGLLAALGSPLALRSAARVFFVSQLGKYLPGSVWPVVAQMQLGRAHRIPRARSAAAAALAMLVSLATALVLAATTLPVAGGGGAGYLWAFAVVPLLLAGLHPRVANPVLRTLFRITRRPPIEPLSGAAFGRTAGRNLAGWVMAGLHIWILAVALGAPVLRTLLLAIGGYAFAWSVGFIIVFAPAGAGVRELILVAALQPVLDPGKATVVALASRLVTIVADLVAAALIVRDGVGPAGASVAEVG